MSSYVLLIADVGFKFAQMPLSYGFESYVRHDFLIGYCFNQEQRRPDAGLLEHLLRPRTVRIKV